MLDLRVPLLALTLLAAGCSAPAAPPADGVYTLRGEIVRLPTPPDNEMLVHHEAIPDFRGRDGSVVGMDSMTMPFPLTPGVKIDGLAAGDKIEFTLELRWSNDDSPVSITRVGKLPAGTQLDFGEPDQPGETPR